MGNDYIDRQKSLMGKVKGWANQGDIYWPVPNVTYALKPGYYKVGNDEGIGINFRQIQVKEEPSFFLNDELFKKIVSEVESFLTVKPLYEKFSFQYKRGIFLHGPQGTGKSSLIRIIADRAINKGAIVLEFSHPKIFEAGVSLIQELHPELMFIGIMEDFDSIWENRNQQDILNLLDGISSVSNVLYLATTNDLSELPDKITKRPSRFDRKYYIGAISDEGKKDLLQELARGHKLKFTQKEWVSETKEFTIAQLKEVFISCMVLGKSFDISVAEVKSNS